MPNSDSHLDLDTLLRSEYHPPDAPTDYDYVAAGFVGTLLLFFVFFDCCLLCRRRTEAVMYSYVQNLWLFSLAASLHTLAVFVSNDHLSWTVRMHTEACVFWEFWLQYCSVGFLMTLILQRLFVYMSWIVTDQLRKNNWVYSMPKARRNRYLALLIMTPVVVLCALVSVYHGSKAVWEDTDDPKTPKFEHIGRTCLNSIGWKAVFTAWAGMLWLFAAMAVIYTCGSGPARHQLQRYVDERTKTMIVLMAALIMIANAAGLALSNALVHTSGRVMWTSLLCVFYGGAFLIIAGKILQKNYSKLQDQDIRMAKRLGQRPKPTVPHRVDLITHSPAWTSAFLKYCAQRCEVEQRVAEMGELDTRDLVYCTRENYLASIYPGHMHVEMERARVTSERADRFRGQPKTLQDIMADEAKQMQHQDQEHLAAKGLSSGTLRQQVNEKNLWQHRLSAEIEQIKKEMLRRADEREPTTEYLLRLNTAIFRWRHMGTRNPMLLSAENMRVVLQEILEEFDRPDKPSYVSRFMHMSQDTKIQDRMRVIEDQPAAAFALHVPGTQTVQRIRALAEDICEYRSNVCDPLANALFDTLARRYFVTFITSDCTGALVEISRQMRDYDEFVERAIEDSLNSNYLEPGSGVTGYDPMGEDQPMTMLTQQFQYRRHPPPQEVADSRQEELLAEAQYEHAQLSGRLQTMFSEVGGVHVSRETEEDSDVWARQQFAREMDRLATETASLEATESDRRRHRKKKHRTAEAAESFIREPEPASAHGSDDDDDERFEKKQKEEDDDARPQRKRRDPKTEYVSIDDVVSGALEQLPLPPLPRDDEFVSDEQQATLPRKPPHALE